MQPEFLYDPMSLLILTTAMTFLKQKPISEVTGFEQVQKLIELLLLYTTSTQLLVLNYGKGVTSVLQV